jgi:hypothetical protein
LRDTETVIARNEAIYKTTIIMSKSRIEGLNIKNTGIDSLIQNTNTVPPAHPEPRSNRPEETSRINFDAPASFKQRLQIHCIKNKTSVKDFIIETLTARLNNESFE